jgi:hypothetical protein
LFASQKAFQKLIERTGDVDPKIGYLNEGKAKISVKSCLKKKRQG